MRATPLFRGRQDELSRLDGHLRRAVELGQELVLVEGDPGIGKSALLLEFARLHLSPVRRRVRFFHLHAPEDGEYWPVHHAALAATSQRVYARLGGRRQAREVVGDLALDWLGIVPMVGDVLSAVAATARALNRRRRRPDADRSGVGNEDVEALLAAARRRPLVLLLDDLDRADERAIAHLERLVCVADEGVRILIVGVYRPTPPGQPDPPIHAMLRRLPLEQESFTHLRLGPLDRDAVRTWLEARYPGMAVPGAFLAWLGEATGGHPGTIHETLAHLEARGSIARGKGSWEVETDPRRLDLPVLAYSFADLSAVSPHVAGAVRAASRLEEEFDAATLAEVLERDELVVEDQLALGVRSGILVHLGERMRADGELTTAFRFASPHLRAVLRAHDGDASPIEEPASRRRGTRSRLAPGRSQPS